MNMPTAVDVNKLIPVQLLPTGANRCPYQQWYVFKKCTIKSCKNWSPKTATSCLAIDREQPTGSKAISDSEIHLFKFAHEGISTRMVSMRRKRAVTRVKCILTLKAFFDFIKTNYNGVDRHLVFRDELLQTKELDYPLKVKRLRFENWMWPMIVDEECYTRFKRMSLDGELNEFGLAELLSVSEQGLSDLKEILTRIQG